VPDLSLTSAGHDGYLIVMNGMQFVVAGTSAASPALASIFAMVVQGTGARLGGANARLYALANQQSSAIAFHDIASGNNSVPGLTGYFAVASYDRASGLGSVDADALVKHWRDGLTAPTLALTAAQASVTLLASTAKTLTLTTAGNAALNSAVTLKLTGVPAGVTGTFSSSVIAAPGSGSSILTFTASKSAQAGSYAVVVTATAGSLTKTVQVTVNVPSLSASTNPTSLTVARGTSASPALTTKSVGGFNSAVAITVSGLPSGVTAKLSSASIASPGAGTVSIQLTAGATAKLGAATITITASGGGVVITAPMTVTISAPPAPSRLLNARVGTAAMTNWN
jgi:uncharacterized membrane protein